MEDFKDTKANSYGAIKNWNALKESFLNWSKKSEKGTFCFNEEKKQQFCDRFDDNYNTILNELMTSNTKTLDAHKQAAIIVISALESNVITQTCQDDEMISLGPYAVVLDVALSFLLKTINEKVKKLTKPIRELSLPTALACERDYFDIMRRLLYYEDPNVKDKGINYKTSFSIIEWADRFFLLEYITLLENHIDPRLVKDIIRNKEEDGRL